MYYQRKKVFLKDKRLLALFAIIVFIALIIIARLFVLQIIRGEKYSDMAEGRHSKYENINPERGEIFVKEFSSEKMYPIATNQELYLVYVEPSKIQNKTLVARVLAENLGLDELELKKILFENDPYEPVAHYISPEIVQKIKSYDLLGVGFEKETKRIYPEKGFGGQILGFVGKSGDSESGKYGIEGYFNELLTGKSGYLEGEKDAFGSIIPWGEKKEDKAINGSNILLTIDRGVQFFACNKIREAVKNFQAESGTVIIMQPDTGKILAICSSPDYDPNLYNKEKDQSIFNNPAIFNRFEPGSIFKPITMAAGIDAKVVSPDSTYNDTGAVSIPPHTIQNSDHKSNGVQTMTQVLEKSLNTGVVHVVKLLGPKKFREYVENFGFDNLTGIELDKEATSDISSLKKKGEIWSATASFGQGVAVTPIQMVNSFNAIANGGKLMKPYIVDRIIDENGVVTQTQPTPIRQAISSRTAALVRGMLVSVVENGHGKRAGVEGYYVGGKTGTAQVAGGGGYEKDKVIGSFAGFAPVDNPVFTMLVTMYDPKTVEWAESSAAPVFGEIAKFLLNYYKVPPER
ncbi:MAG: penicillin-binding protein 2 [Patescibacteria group bacterium]